MVDIVALKTIKMRGQAFIAFKDIADSAAAMRSLQRFVFYDRPLHISYAKKKSNIFKSPHDDIYPNKRPSSDIEENDEGTLRKKAKLEPTLEN